MMWGYDGWGLGGFGMGIGMLLFWGVIIAAVVFGARGFGKISGNTAPGPREKSALEILAERYAKGEIDRNEFEQKRGDLQGMNHRSAGPGRD